MTNRRFEDRRRELGRMLLDVAKYLATVGLIGGILTGGLSFISALVITLTVLFIIVVAFFIIPPKTGV
ncbi:MAG: hypothetical protein ACE5IY_03240 [bacterium]